MTTVAALIAGFVLAFLLVRIAIRAGANWPRPYAIGLVIAAAIYVVFAASASADPQWLAVEAAGVLLFGGAAWLGVRRVRLLLAAGWALHVLWDVLLHIRGGGSTYTPGWYPWLCVSFDLVIAGAVLLALRSSDGRRRHVTPVETTVRRS